MQNRMKGNKAGERERQVPSGGQGAPFSHMRVLGFSPEVIGAVGELYTASSVSFCSYSSGFLSTFLSPGCLPAVSVGVYVFRE